MYKKISLDLVVKLSPFLVIKKPISNKKYKLSTNFTDEL